MAQKKKNFSGASRQKGETALRAEMAHLPMQNRLAT